MMPRHGRDDTTLGRRALWVLAILAVALGGYLAYRRLVMGPAAAPETVAEPPVAVAPEPVIQNPLVSPHASEPLPQLNESDAAVADGLAALLGREVFESLFLTDDLIRRITATIDNLPREKVAARLRPLKPMDSPFVAAGGEGDYTLAAGNYVRYAPYVAIVERLDTDNLAAYYVRLYPLFQQAYVELGNVGGYFNDRVVEVIDHLLAAPEVQGPIALTRPNVMYQFADPALESRSAGQKFLVRMGPENAARVKAKLRALRERIAGQAPPA